MKMPTCLTNDLLFKETLAHPDNRDKLIYFLATFTNFSEEYLKNTDMRVLYESVLLKTKINDKAYRGDVLIVFDDTKINLECYSDFDQASFMKSLVYVMRIYSTGMERGTKDYEKLDKVVGINFIDNIDEDCVVDKDETFTKGVFVYNGKLELSDTVRIEFYQIAKARKEPLLVDDKKNVWLKFLGAKDYNERKIIAKGDRKLMELNEWVETYINDTHTKEVFGKWAENIALEKGKRKGEMKGKKEVVQNMIKANFSLDVIHQMTDLPLTEIKKIEDEINKSNK